MGTYRGEDELLEARVVGDLARQRDAGGACGDPAPHDPPTGGVGEVFHGIQVADVAAELYKAHTRRRVPGSAVLVRAQLHPVRPIVPAPSNIILVFE